MGTILENLERIHALVVVDKLRKLNNDVDEKFGDQLAAAAVKAITAGINSEEWKAYMSFFADNEAQLNLLTKPQVGEKSYLPTSRAYIVSNAVCGASTDTNISLKVDRDLGNGIAGGENGTVNKPFPLPEVNF